MTQETPEEVAERPTYGAGIAGSDRTESDRADADRDGAQLDREDRQALRRVAGLSTELQDVTEVGWC
jgi:GTP-binding protein HflX